ncbi:alpha/beta-hydrolase [Melanomma pulvis-pyrius CBS 109.77]|uniref:Alpha/beta-hydrolase n=1 Tax=Melanomma pulvis-pyrius CBS 109.77 TaxID=1314802 RepID=A0A6A6XST3_9PLEO|nr:alpha/beta-hydrolase [Melanomma pulvis-pyrius CBS 109.77]
MALTQKALPVEHQYEMDEFNCLQLNISAPKRPAPSKDYPVAVWIHGGGNCVGSGAEPGYDMAAIAQHSIKQGQPTVFVTINYRLGIFGFLASGDLKKDNAAAGDEGVGNYALRDQLLAFEWIRKHISAFGGDPAKVTAIGHSAGSSRSLLELV